ncbi:MliC family protein [Tamlana sp. s12]|uniref:MliC family protein n=1 Tax=Tamlana sp. s12 TaxID=1630406 RepID=UPI0007FDBEFD|nr:MliC family protein [Tamlana sp. s12]OBQ55110.1 hypothetical protein VQ01_10290 [Tamlana sp. s12]QQY83221.1 MliC family protein [Tamlana sp. s12]
MIKHLFSVAIFLVLVVFSCKESQSKAEQVIHPAERTTDEIVKSTAKDAQGKELHMIFNNTQGTATLEFEGDTIEVMRMRSGSGFWYKNNTYELRGKGDSMTFKKDDVTVFEN